MILHRTQCEANMIFLNAETNQDTLASCCYSLAYANNYMRGEYRPHYPVPVIKRTWSGYQENYYSNMCWQLYWHTLPKGFRKY
jgi:hypothetical protein